MNVAVGGEMGLSEHTAPLNRVERSLRLFKHLSGFFVCETET